ncbi:MAG: hypothetical protein ACLUD2_06625 [Clostridium sp.]
MLPIIDKMDKIGYYAVECWGGATFDACSSIPEGRSVGETEKVKSRL